MSTDDRKLLRCDCPDGVTPNYCVTLVTSEAIYFLANGVYYTFDPECGSIRGYSIYEKTQVATLILPEENTVFIGKRIEYVDGFKSYSVFEINPTIAEHEGSGMVRVEKPLPGYSTSSTKNSLTIENATEIMMGHIRMLHKYPGSDIIKCSRYSIIVDEEKSLPIENIFYLT